MFIIRAGEFVALQKRPKKGLLAGLWQFPNVEGTLEIQQALEAVARMGIKPRQILKQVERKHIFTHVQWQMRGIYLLADAPDGNFTWMTDGQIRAQAALPTAFRQFWEEEDHV